MSTDLAPPQIEPHIGSSIDPTVRAHWKRNRVLIGVGAFGIVGAIAAALVGSAQHHGELDPRSYDAHGTHALAALLGQRGVHVTTLTDPAVAERQAVSGSTLVVVRPQFLSAEELRGLAGTPADLVVVGASSDELAGLDLGVVPTLGDSSKPRQPSCSLPAATVAGPADIDGDGYRVPPSGQGCYPDGDGYALVSFDRGGRPVTLLAGAAPLTNANLGAQGNAALALGLLDAHPDVEWLLPPAVAPDSVAGPRKSLTNLLPDRLTLAVVQLGLAVIVIALWRGRRMGRLVREDLPVVVRQAETVLGRGRLYRRSRALDRAAEALREGSRGRLSHRLGFGVSASRAPLVEAVAARSARPATQIDTLLYGSTPADDRALVALAQTLTTLEQEVLRT